MHDELGRLARTQYGAFTRDQALDCGFTQRAIRSNLRHGLWRELQSGVYAAASTPDTPALFESAALLAAGPGAVLCGRSAAARWHLAGFVLPERPEIAVPHDRQVSLRDVTVRRLKPDVLARCVVRAGRRVLSLEDTVREVVHQLAPADAEALVTEVVNRARTTSVRRLRAVCHRGRRGSSALRRTLELCSDRAQSLWERRLVHALQAAGIAVEVNWAVVDASGRRRYLDICIPGARLIIEVDGFATHGPYEQFQRDRRRKRRLVLGQRWYVIEMTPRDIRDHLDQVVAEIAGFLAAA